ncbi:MAG: Patatin-like phospholipase [Syntrophorhabdus sp. PtaU1.Bin002]|nr:MAG: Patatin-like phospholipase [Syntrophorhabdus sp. PtaU1.Bin002]
MKSEENTVVDFEQIKKDELDKIRKRRRDAGIEPGNPETDTVGLALSGGGIRSATFNLGILQSLERYSMLKYIDYLSTVSGGGYIGASLTWFMTRLGYPFFPFGTSRQDHSGFGGKVLERIRAYGNYLTPGEGLTLWALIAAILSGMIINFLVVLPVFFFLVWLLSVDTGTLPPFTNSVIDWLFYTGFITPTTIDWLQKPTVSVWLFFLGVIFFAIFLASVLLYSASTKFSYFGRYAVQRWVSKYMGYALIIGIIIVVVSTIPLVYESIKNLSEWIKTSMSSISLAGVLSAASALIKRKPGKEAQGIRSFLLSLGLALITYGLFLWFYHLTGDKPFSLWWVIFLGSSLVFAFLADINHVSMHRFYRNRLMEAYMPYKLRKDEKGRSGKDSIPDRIVDNTPQPPRDLKPTDADQCYLWKLYRDDEEDSREAGKGIKQTAPYHIINTNMQTIGSKVPKLRERGGENFIFSALYCGSESTGYRKAKDYMKGRANLATAMAISGAAVDPNTYATRSRPLTFIMTLLNVRLGYWLRNPSCCKDWRNWMFKNPTWYYMFVEMFGRGLNEKRLNIHLSDGGHFENLGLYELVKRRCRYIIACDASADPDYSFEDLGKVIEKVRIDFGAKIDIDITLLKAIKKKEKISPMAYVAGEVTYADETKADLIYVNTTLIEELPEDIYTYQKQNPSFPDQGTGDQFFDERQFEAYRELGFQIGRRLLCRGQCMDLPQLVEAVKKAMKDIETLQGKTV